MSKAALINLSDPNHHKTLAEILTNGGVVGSIWGHHLYFLACNACDPKAVAKMNSLKNRPATQTFVSPGAVEDAQELADLEKCPALLNSSQKMGMTPIKYLEFLFKKFPLGVELIAKDNVPNSLTFATDVGKTIWIAAHMGDKNYTKLLKEIRNLRKIGKKVIFAGTSLNLKGANTLTVNQLDQVLNDFGHSLDAISVHPKEKKLKRLSFNTSCSVISFISSNPKLLRLGCTNIKTLSKYIPDLEIPSDILNTRK
ncbi:MAG: hypothetical protein ACD_30C00040G0022 [uncultured bacterium]|uniref:YrdC-like domain-containing protein n=4 Tax=Candidatus Daviesiibacteriota TaxID=1752718 RepID=A0A0G0HDJ9_9BACT|nr:MAG: hypothetical protein ACD_30C00040G0022 [uncultured bacterium]KKQ10174.1 MAG: hypothetical protein US19_C0008G0017 [Candidatus Daviesbacteria bacterium GW2011_GWB1_36_5]KKQ13736.1 MAG: hypothetical protein US28_C0045G0004 [Candidatus Daviesbacteria bacterium GW2011_GWA1_36_8]OGE17149.1 MAG: hypothetical protein A2858_00395 [Candidatus Daviesbacteria bacterium RIFCSPHIGHO2_01_FULL_36_37]OGE35930.1 MAG: hypothetical protein A3E66_01390 [Candidatus Daviesbacteria bacterium RIFCSPHIGHO2_12_F